MSTQIRGPSPHFHPFYQNNFVLMQFILEEFISAYQLTLEAKILVENQLDGKESFSISPSLIQNLEQLIGSPLHQEHPFISRWNQGPLTKLKEYCEQFSHNSSHESTVSFNLHISTHQAWLMAMNTIEILNSIHVTSCRPNKKSSAVLLPIYRSFKTFQIRFNQVCRTIPRVLYHYAENENIIYYLLRRKDDLSEIYGSDFLQKWFNGSKQSSDIIKFLKNRYLSRGFKSLLPSLLQLSESLLDDDCHTHSNSNLTH